MGEMQIKEIKVLYDRPTTDLLVLTFPNHNAVFYYEKSGNRWRYSALDEDEKDAEDLDIHNPKQIDPRLVEALLELRVRLFP